MLLRYMMVLLIRGITDMYHKKWYSEASHMVTKVGTTPSIPRLAGRHTLRNNEPSSVPEEYYRGTVTVPSMDHLLLELNKR